MRALAKQQGWSDGKAGAMRPAQIDRLRNAYVAMIGTMRQCERGPNAFLDKAQKLLTRHWIRANWSTRADILKSVDWLLQVSVRGPVADGKRMGAAEPVRRRKASARKASRQG